MKRFPQPPYAGDAWEYRSFNGPIPEGWTEVSEGFAKRQVSKRKVYPIRPWWRWTRNLIDGDVYTVLETRE